MYTTNNNVDITGTSFHHNTITATTNELSAILGEPMVGGSDDGKISIEWRVVAPSGEVVALYDWKEPQFDRWDMVDWHLGSKSHMAEVDFECWLLDKLEELR